MASRLMGGNRLGLCRLALVRWHSVMREKNDPDQQKNNGATDNGVGNIKSPPTLQMVTEEIYIEKIKINKIDHLAVIHAIDDIAESSAGNKGQGKSDGTVLAIGPHVVDNKTQNNQRKDQVIGSRTEICPHGAPFVKDERQHKEVPDYFHGGILTKETHRPDFGRLIGGNNGDYDKKGLK